MDMWKPIPGFSMYEASSSGHVRNVKTNRLVASNLGSHGYLMGNMKSDDGKWGARLLHAVIATAFYGPRPIGYDCCHNDGDRANNRAENLRWDTRLANVGDQKKHGTFSWHGSKKLRDEDVPLVIARAETGERFDSIARDFGVTRNVVSTVLRGQNRANLTGRAGIKVGRRYHRGHKMKGVLKESDVLEIVTKIDSGVPQKELALRYAVTPQTISNINVGMTWSWLTGRRAAA